VYVLSTNPIGEFAQELVYLRIRELRQPALLVLVVLLLELAEHILPFLVRQGLLRPAPDFALFVNAAQAVLVAAAAVAILLVVRRYTHRALDRRIRESMETLAYLEGQRRRRRSLDRGDWDARDEE
jgi:membrane protein implicated in regulation of membrane protease activity